MTINPKEVQGGEQLPHEAGELVDLDIGQPEIEDESLGQVSFRGVQAPRRPRLTSRTCQRMATSEARSVAHAEPGSVEARRTERSCGASDFRRRQRRRSDTGHGFYALRTKGLERDRLKHGIGTLRDGLCLRRGWSADAISGAADCFDDGRSAGRGDRERACGVDS